MSETHSSGGSQAEAGSIGDMRLRCSLVEEIAQAVFLKLEDKQVHTQRLFDIDQAARYLGMSPYSLRHKAGLEIPVVRLDAKLRFDRRDLDKFIDAAKREGG
jgi:hypothetical protein